MIRKFCNTINVFAVAFDQFNASLLNKSINLFKKMLLNASVATEIFISTAVSNTDNNKCFLILL